MGRAIAVKRWTPTALECYKRGCVCEGCFYSDFFSATAQKCQMKAAVLELVRTIGAPNVDLPQIIEGQILPVLNYASYYLTFYLTKNHVLYSMNTS